VSTSLTTVELDANLSVADTLRRFQECPFLLMLDSAGHIREQDARYTFLTADPVETVRLDRPEYGSDPFAAVRKWQRRLPKVDGDHPPFCGGIAGMMSYELGGAFERVPVPDRDEFAIPALLAGLFDWAIVWDHIEPSVRLCVLNLEAGTASMPGRVDWVLHRLKGKPPETVMSSAAIVSAADKFAGRHPLSSAPNVYSTSSREDYITAVERVIEYIRAGDIFQANLSQQLSAAWSQSAIELYRHVRVCNPAPFCGFLQADDFAIVSASPERFLKVTGGKNVETRPIKGTRRRHRSPIADLYTGDELSNSEKDRAENVMIVDLLRNDLSRVCRAGSVKVTGLCEIEVFQMVQHLVSTVVGELRDDCDIWDLCAATIPGGSITGAPKIRAMEIIAELEPALRGAYCGNFFCVGPNGEFDSSILIRTFTLKNGMLQFPVGGGIVADSEPAAEYAETLHKAAGLLRTLRAGDLT
jgi:para-aminobenzoate synthetase component 1